MQRFINFVVKYKEYISLVALIVISMSLISMGNVSKIGGFRTIVIGSVGWLQEIFSWIPNPTALKNENRAVRELNYRLSSEVTRMRRSMLENKKLREMIGFGEKLEQDHISAEVVGKSTLELRSYITINRGYGDNLDIGMSVRTDGGLVGMIIGTSEHYSLVELISNRNVKIAAKVQRNSIIGIVAWEGGDNFQLKNIPESYDIRKGDVILTSNYSNKYPDDVPIGEIVKIENDPSSLFQKVSIKPFVNFSSLEQVFVIRQLPDPERIKLLKDMAEQLKKQNE